MYYWIICQGHQTLRTSISSVIAHKVAYISQLLVRMEWYFLRCIIHIIDHLDHWRMNWERSEMIHLWLVFKVLYWYFSMDGVSKNMQKVVSTKCPTVMFSHMHVEGSLQFMGRKQQWICCLRCLGKSFTKKLIITCQTAWCCDPGEHSVSKTLAAICNAVRR